jgi:hypothetical protein
MNTNVRTYRSRKEGATKYGPRTEGATVMDLPYDINCLLRYNEPGLSESASAEDVRRWLDSGQKCRGIGPFRRHVIRHWLDGVGAEPRDSCESEQTE